MKLPLPSGWKLGAWLTISLAWSACYLVLSLLEESPAGGLLQQLFNWLFPIVLLYLLLTVGRQHR